MRRGHYQWFLTRDGRSYFAKGYNGQYVFVHRDGDVVVVRFGEGYGDVDWPALFTQMAEGLSAPRPAAARATRPAPFTR